MISVNWVLDNWDLMGVVLGIVFTAVEVVRATGNLRQGLLSLMLQAEKAAGKGELGGITGTAIMDAVVTLAMQRIVPRLPVYVRPFVTEARVRTVALWVYEHTREYLEHGRLLPPESTPEGGEMEAPPQP